jgi:hypothetical protein
MLLMMSLMASLLSNETLSEFRALSIVSSAFARLPSIRTPIAVNITASYEQRSVIII